MRKQLVNLFLSLARRLAGRSYASAMINRLTADWTTIPTTANRELRFNLRTLRARSRQLSRDDDYMRRFLHLLKTNVVGAQGIQLQVRLINRRGRNEIETNQVVEASFNRWGKAATCTVTERMTWRSVLELIMRSVAVDGEAFIRFVPANNKWGLSLQLINPDWLDESYNEALSNGNRVIMSVELDQYDRPVAYYLTPPRSADLTEIGTEWERRRDERLRVPASSILHVFVQDEVGQVRGVPFVHTAAKRLNMLGAYEEAELVHARVAACQMMLLEPTEDAILDDQAANVEMDTVSPAAIWRLPAGYQVREFKPNSPSTSYADYVKAVLKGVASGLNVAYHSLANDLEGVNYSSARVGTLEERDYWRLLQQFLIEQVCDPVFSRWVDFAIGTEALPLPLERADQIKEAARWLPRGWAWVDPAKDIKADVEALAAGLRTRAEICAERGVDFESLAYELADEQQLLKELGLISTIVINNKQSMAAPVESGDGSAGRSVGVAVSAKSGQEEAGHDTDTVRTASEDLIGEVCAHE